MSRRKRGWLAKKIERLYYSHYNKQISESLIEEGLIRIFEEAKEKLGNRCYQSIGLSLNRVVPLHEENKSELDIIFWRVADNWDTQIKDAYLNWREKMTSWVQEG